MDQRAHHVGGIAHALLVGEGGDDDRPRRGKAHRLQALDRFQPGKHAIAAVIDAGVDHRVDVRAEHEWVAPRVVVIAPDAEDVADAVDGDLEPRFPQPTEQAIAAKPVHVGGGDADKPPLRIAAEAAEFLDAAEKAVGVDRQVAHAGCLARTTSSGAILTSSA